MSGTSPMFQINDPEEKDQKKDESVAQPNSVEKPPITEEPPQTDELPADDPYMQRFRELGLDRTYRDPRQALESIPELHRKFTQTSQQFSELRRLLAEREQRRPEQRPESTFDEERFATAPREVLDERYVRQDHLSRLEQRISDLQRQVSEQLVSLQEQQLYSANPEYREYEADIIDIYNQIVYANTPQDRLDNLLRLAKALKGIAPASGDGGQPRVQRVSQQTKESAQTSRGSRGGPACKVQLNVKDYARMTPEELEKSIGFGEEKT